MAVTGAELIAVERRRQTELGYSAGDDRETGADELALAGAIYAAPDHDRAYHPEFDRVPAQWPWADATWKPTPHDRVRELTKAGALIAAAIDVALDATSQSDKHGGAAPVPSDPDPLTHWIDDGCPGGHRV